MHKILPITLAIALLLSCDETQLSTPQHRAETAEDLRIKLKTLEQMDPTQYLRVDEHRVQQNVVKEGGFFSDPIIDGWLLTGTVTNTASIASFKDIVFTVTFKSQTQTLIQAIDYTAYIFFEPNQPTPFSIKIDPPEAAVEFDLAVKSATPAN